MLLVPLNSEMVALEGSGEEKRGFPYRQVQSSVRSAEDGSCGVQFGESYVFINQKRRSILCFHTKKLE